MNTPQTHLDLDGYREHLRQRLAVLIERMDSHSIALARLVSVAEPSDKREPEPTPKTPGSPGQ